MERETLSPIAKGIMQGLNEAIAYMEDKNIVGVRVSEIKRIQPREIRQKLNMSQQEFYNTVAISPS